MIEVNGKAASVFGLTAPNGSSGLVLDADQRFLFELVNRSGEATIVHWHGQTPPTDQDGVVETGYEGPIENGGKAMSYDFRDAARHALDDHSHLGLQEQALLAAPLIIRSHRGRFGGSTRRRSRSSCMTSASRTRPSFCARLREKASWLTAARRPRASRARPRPRLRAPAVYRTLMRGCSVRGRRVLNDIDYDAYLANERTLDDPFVLRTERGGRGGFASSTARAAPRSGSTSARWAAK